MMNSTSLVANVSSRLSRLGDAIAEFFDRTQYAIVLLDPLLRSERERLLQKGDVGCSTESSKGTPAAGWGIRRANQAVHVVRASLERSVCEFEDCSPSWRMGSRKTLHVVA